MIAIIRIQHISISAYQPISVACSLPCVCPSGVTFVGLGHRSTAIRPNSTDPADRIHGWHFAGNNGVFFSLDMVFFAHIAFRKWDGKYTSTHIPGLVLYHESLTRLVLVDYFTYSFFGRLSVHPLIRADRNFLHHDLGLLGNKNWLYMYTGHGHLFPFPSSSLRPCATFGREGYLLGLVSPCRLRITRLRLLGMSFEQDIFALHPKSIKSCKARRAGALLMGKGSSFVPRIGCLTTSPQPSNLQ